MQSPMDTPARPPTVVLGVSGSIAAYKAVEVVRLLGRAGVRVLPAMTASAQRFLGAATLAGITGERVSSDMWDPGIVGRNAAAAPGGAPAPLGEIHVELARLADLVVFAPATADLLAAMAHGFAGDVVRALALSARSPILVAPAMHPRMWSHPATQRNVRQLAADGRVQFIGPVDGPVASGETGVGRMAEPSDIAAAALALLARRADLAGTHVVVTAGPTVEDIDPVRFLSNRSSGRMGFAIAGRAAARGARVTLVAGPVTLATPFGVTRIDVRSAAELARALAEVLGADLCGADALVMAAAVADYRVAAPASEKLKRSAADLALVLTPNPDVLAGIGAARRGDRPMLVGFALETVAGEALATVARHKLEHKRVDLVVANSATTLDRPDNDALLVTHDAVEALGSLPKHDLADRILDRVAARCRR